ncbi:hypothetical protein [Oceanicaulis sp.]|uniref:hypothetical protein n=1 Tax=Oceanicaulis sp. TaxID=1924941 RepID=UPI003F715AEB
MDFNAFERLYEDTPIPVSLSGPDGKLLVSKIDGKHIIWNMLPPDAPSVAARCDEIDAQQRIKQDEGKLTIGDRKFYETQRLAATIAGWSENWTWNGETLPFSQANAERFLASKAGKMLRGFLLVWRRSNELAWSALQRQPGTTGAGADASTESTQKTASREKKSSRSQRATVTKTQSAS